MTFAYILIGVAVVVLVLVGKKMRGRNKLSSSAAKRVKKLWQQVLAIEDPVRFVFEADKVVDQLMQELGYSGSFADKLKVAGPRMPNLQSIWDAHKLRNKVAHETGFVVGEKERRFVERVYGGVIAHFS